MKVESSLKSQSANQRTKHSLWIFMLLMLLAQALMAQTTIVMQKENGVYVIPCRVNGLNLKFIFDTGASDVSISLTEAAFMLKNGYMDAKDIVGEEYYSDANGDISVGTKIILNKIEFAGIELNKVEATVVNNIGAPLLLGQSAIKRLGQVQIDFARGTLTILNGPNRNFGVTGNSDRAIYVSPSRDASGTMKVSSVAVILDNPDKVKGKVIGKAKNDIVEIVARVTKDFYRVKSGALDGYMWEGYFISQVSK